MILEHLGKRRHIHPSVYVAPSATICGDVDIGEDARILLGTSVIAEDTARELERLISLL